MLSLTFLLKWAKQVLFMVLALFSLMFGVSAHAALDPAVATTFTSIQTDFMSAMGLAWPVIGAVFAALAIIGLVKAALNRGGIRA